MLKLRGERRNGAFTTLRSSKELVQQFFKRPGKSIYAGERSTMIRRCQNDETTLPSCLEGSTKLSLKTQSKEQQEEKEIFGISHRDYDTYVE